MTAVAYASDGLHNSFAAMSSTATTALSSQAPANDQYFTTFFCRALYDYQTMDASSLSFHKDDIIEVLTQLESGWWDGLLRDERGWFPSNYVDVITDEEAEAALSASEISTDENSGPPSETLVDMSHALMQEHSLSEHDRPWVDAELHHVNHQNGRLESVNAAMQSMSPTSDFWMPQVTSDGQIFYINTQTGQHSRDLPQEPDDETSDVDLAALTSQSSSRSGTSVGLGLSSSERSENSQESGTSAGFGVPKRSGTPEPWVRRLADDGMAYYYWNKLDGRVVWTMPEPVGVILRDQAQSRDHSSSNRGVNRDNILQPNRLRSDSSVSQTPQHVHSAANRLSMYSDDSDVHPHDQEHSYGTSQPLINGRRGHIPIQARADMELTSAERLAQSLQKTLAPSPPELVTDLSITARQAIAAVVENIRLNGFARGPEEDTAMDGLVRAVVLAVRNLLYVSAAPTGHIPSHLVPREARDTRVNTTSQTMLKPAQRKVTATLSKVVLSARAMQYDSSSASADTTNRIEGDAEELERAVTAFVLEVERCHSQIVMEHMQGKTGLKRLRGVFSTANVGLGLVGAGAAGTWKGFGWVALDEDEESPGRILGTEVVNELGSFLSQVEDKLNTLSQALRSLDVNSVNRVRGEGQNVTTCLSSFLIFLANIHIARHVDVDGISRESSAPSNDLYTQAVEKARILVRTVEAAVQSLYDDGSMLLLVIESIRHLEPGQSRHDRDATYDYLDALITSLKSNLGVVQQTLESLLSIGHDQADVAQGDYNGSIEWRMSRLSMIDNHIGGAIRPMSAHYGSSDPEGGEIVNFEMAFRTPGSRIGQDVEPIQNGSLYRSDSDVTGVTLTNGNSSLSVDETSVNTSLGTDSLDAQPESIDAESGPLFDDETTSAVASMAKAQHRKADKLRDILGDEAPQHYLETVNADLKPWFLRPNYSQTEILIDPDGTVRGGTVPALVERLTAHEHGDPTFIKTFLMTYKSFTSLDELFDLLVQRFWIQPPAKLSSSEHEEWVKLKQHVIQMRVLNTFKSMVGDADVLEKEDMYILNRMKAFISNEEVNRFAAAKQLVTLIERAQRGGDAMIRTMVNTGQQNPPAPIIPRTSKKLKLLDIDPLELARQLTILESQLYQKIRPMECLQRAREQKTEHNDNIATIIQTSNRIADWVADAILSKDDARRRAAAVKQFISVADRCRALHNYSTMVAITSGLNTPPIRRLKRTWEQVNAKFMSQLAACEMTIDSNKNFNNYRLTLASVTPPCVPFIGVFLTTLQFIQDASKDTLPGNLVNFRKRQKASEVIQDIKRWQSQPFAFHSIPSVGAYIDQSLSQFNDAVDIRDHFWNLSLEREPREREDEKMARMLQESGFL